jgi:hypothetical protein
MSLRVSELVQLLEKLRRKAPWKGLLPGVERAALDASLAKARVRLPAEIVDLYTWCRGSTRHFIYVYDLIRFDEALAHHVKPPKIRGWRSEWFPLFTSMGGWRSPVVIAADLAQAKAGACPLLEVDAYYGPIEIEPAYDSLTALARTLERGLAKKLLRHKPGYPFEPPEEDDEDLVPYEALWAELNPRAAKARAVVRLEQARQRAAEALALVPKLERVRGPSSARGVDQLVEMARAVATTSHPRRVHALLRARDVLLDFGACSSIESLLEQIPEADVAPVLLAELRAGRPDIDELWSLLAGWSRRAGRPWSHGLAELIAELSSRDSDRVLAAAHVLAGVGHADAVAPLQTVADEAAARWPKQAARAIEQQVARALEEIAAAGKPGRRKRAGR